VFDSPLALFLATIAAILALAGVLHLVPKMGVSGRRLSGWLCRAPGIDLVLMWFTLLPQVVGAIVGGWAGLGAAVAGQVAGMLLWIALHELAHPAARRGPRIVRTLGQLVGHWRNHLALWMTALVVPLFWAVRFAQVFIYPVLTWTVHLPKYRQAELVNLSRHKFSGLIGYDLIWCLYCDWMTGVWSLGSEMLRNVESFWCPIRFSDATKCERCRVDFPDVDHGWVAADGTMADVVAVLESKYGPGENPWYGHPTRLTLEGDLLETPDGHGPRSSASLTGVGAQEGEDA
jgi:hypothetical protein